jgi:hypothetical protein
MDRIKTCFLKTHFRCQMSDVRFQISNIKYQISDLGFVFCNL